MAKHKVVVFTNGVAKIVKTNDISAYVNDKKTCFIDPILHHVRTVSPELWEVVDNKIVAISDPIKLRVRMDSLSSQAINNQHKLNHDFDAQFKRLELRQKKAIIYICIAIALSYLTIFLTHN